VLLAHVAPAYCDTIARNFGVPPPLDQRLPAFSRHGFCSVAVNAMNLDCIEAVVSGRRIAVPVRSVERLAELEVRGPMPLAHRWVGGLGRSEADAVVTLALAAPEGRRDGGPRTTTALILKERSGDARWAIEVDRVLGFRQLSVAPLPGGAARGFQCPAEWLAGTGDEAIVLVDTEAVSNGLGASGPTSPQLPA
jgi:hypothetical protein